MARDNSCHPSLLKLKQNITSVRKLLSGGARYRDIMERYGVGEKAVRRFVRENELSKRSSRLAAWEAKGL